MYGSTLVEIKQVIRRQRFLVEHAQQRHDLAAMVGRVIHQVLHYVGQRVRVLLARHVHIGKPLQQPLFGQVIEEVCLVDKTDCQYERR